MNKHHTLICVALESELPRSKFQDAPILYTGVGKINAAISLMNYLHNYPEIKRVINVGSAGGIKEWVYRGRVYEFGTFREDLSFPNHQEEIIKLNDRGLIISTFDQFQTVRPPWPTYAVDMESFALAKVCVSEGREFQCYKYISDLIGDDNQEQVWIEEYSNGQNLLVEQLKKI